MILIAGTLVCYQMMYGGGKMVEKNKRIINNFYSPEVEKKYLEINSCEAEDFLGMLKEKYLIPSICVMDVIGEEGKIRYNLIIGDQQVELIINFKLRRNELRTNKIRYVFGNINNNNS